MECISTYYFFLESRSDGFTGQKIFQGILKTFVDLLTPHHSDLVSLKFIFPFCENEMTE